MTLHQPAQEPLRAFLLLSMRLHFSRSHLASMSSEILMFRRDEDVAIPQQMQQTATTTPLHSKADVRTNRSDKHHEGLGSSHGNNGGAIGSFADPELADAASLPRKIML
jgi:hypothetical protein